MDPRAKSLVFGALIALAACGGEEQPAPAPTAPPREPPPVEAPAPVEDEACAQVVVVAWQGAVAASADVTRSEDEARAKAEALRVRIDGGEDFGLLARAESDASASGPRGGLLGTYTRADWPSVHAPIREAVFGLEVAQTSDVIRAPYGWVIARRCPVEKVHTRHILVRYAGARNAGEEVTRTSAEARAEAERIRGLASAPGADFAALAGEHSEDASAEQGGDLGDLGRGRLAPAYEEAAFALRPGQVSAVVETEFGFHVIQRVPASE
jgi:peptidyl-prolyl cis-trans isomerase SurA